MSLANVTRRFRNIWKFLLPGWLQTGQGELVLFVQGMLKDALAERAHQTARLHYPSVCPSDALYLHGVSRALPRGFIEPEASYRARLVQWRWPRGHRIRGNAPGLLEQVAAAVHGTEHTTIDARGTRYVRDVDGAERGVAWDWDGQTLTANWGRFWIVVESSGAPWPTFGDGAWGPTIGGDPDICFAGSGIHPGELNAVVRACRPGSLSWVPAGRRAIYLVLRFAGDPYPEPDGTWDEWENRDPTYRYVPLHDSIE